MFSILIVDKNRVVKHVGEEYDEYVEVDAFVDPQGVPALANQIRNKIREIIIENKAEESVKQVKVVLDATPIYGVIAVGLSESMLAEEGIELLLPEELDVQDRAKEIEKGEIDAQV